MREKKKVPLIVNGQVIREVEVSEENGVYKVELEPSDLKRVFSNYNPAEGLSIAYADLPPVEETFAGPYIDPDIALSEGYYKNFPEKGTFDA